MRSIYIDNIRGFTDTYIPIKDVNFLVGENSTGKTTILEIIKLLSDRIFWISQNFDSIDGIRFNGYQSIVSVNSKDKSYFRLGIIEHNVGSAYLLTFSDQDEIPVLSEYFYMRGEYEIKVIFHENDFKYKVNHIDQPSNSKTDICQIFKSRINYDKDDSAGYTEVKLQSEHKTSLPAIIEIVKNIAMSNMENIKLGLGSVLEMISPVVFPDLTKIQLVWLAPIRSKPKRTYDEYRYSFSPEGDHIPYLLRQMLSKKEKSLTSKKNLELLNSFGKDSRLFDSIGIKEFGDDLASPFEVDVIMNDNPLAISEVGYGVPQALPIIIELIARQKGTWYAIQQPEIHLHPRAQAALGELFYLMAFKEEKRFFIETHSDYIVDRFRMCYQKNEKKDLDSQVLFFEKTPTGNKVYPIEIEKTGQYSENQPPTFREFFIKEEMALLGV
jgi:AAA15 family ATPase/GTPase